MSSTRKVCVMQEAATYLEIIRERGKKGLPLERVYRQLFNRDLFLMAYGKIYQNKGAMTHGVTEETPDGMSLEKIQTLSEKIHDGRFINLLRKLFDAGYMEDWTFNETLSGVPQGGIVSPLLANILLDKLDTFVETVLIPKYTKGVKRKKNREYDRLMTNSLRLRERGHVQEAEEMRKKAQKLPSQDMNDPDYRRLRYVRYADDFLLGFIGPKSEAEEIKQQLKEFLQETLKLELFETKTLMTHART